MAMRLTVNRLLISVLALNVIDIIVHILAGRVEALRITGNIVIMVAALLIVFDVVKSYRASVLTGASGIYLVLNAGFVYLLGMPGPLFFVFVVLSVLLTIAAARKIANG